MVCWCSLREDDEMDYSEDLVRQILGHDVLCQVAKSEPCGVIQGREELSH